MKLTLHLGFHKTASTHLQRALSLAVLGKHSLRYVDPLEFREKTFWHPCRFRGLDQIKSGAYLNELALSENIIISDENICGHSDDIFKHSRLYEHIYHRLCTLREFSDQFDKTEVWVVIRNPATFLPSIYCEAMRWKPYEHFSEVMSGDYHQRWLPVILDIRKALPNCKINVLCYENYGVDTLALFEDLGLDKTVFRETQSDVVRRSPSAGHITLYKYLSFILPRWIQKIIFKWVERLTISGNDRFSPFSNSEISALNAIYKDDIASIKREAGLRWVE